MRRAPVVAPGCGFAARRAVVGALKRVVVQCERGIEELYDAEQRLRVGLLARQRGGAAFLASPPRRMPAPDIVTAAAADPFTEAPLPPLWSVAATSPLHVDILEGKYRRRFRIEEGAARLALLDAFAVYAVSPSRRAQQQLAALPVVVDVPFYCSVRVMANRKRQENARGSRSHPMAASADSALASRQVIGATSGSSGYTFGRAGSTEPAPAPGDASPSRRSLKPLDASALSAVSTAWGSDASVAALPRYDGSPSPTRPKRVHRLPTMGGD
jgi:hypothetical protein